MNRPGPLASVAGRPHIVRAAVDTLEATIRPTDIATFVVDDPVVSLAE
jgi:hypothetical protein